MRQGRRQKTLPESLQTANVKICQFYASAMAKQGRSPVILVTTNPVEALIPFLLK